ncbi:hypothetical protein H6F96_14435 [Microcoleus sp. FACHB-53]|nr:hypothetical protein [Microcoleus sp. FACHB-53]
MSAQDGLYSRWNQQEATLLQCAHECGETDFSGSDKGIAIGTQLDATRNLSLLFIHPPEDVIMELLPRVICLFLIWGKIQASCECKALL